MVISQFENQQYINLETFKKNGQGVKTPVWFVLADGVLYTRTMANSWKVKRLNRNPQVRVAPCDAQGNVLGEWVNGRAYEIHDDAQAKQINDLMNKKYGLLKRGFDLMGKIRGRQMTAVCIELNQNEG
jgi:hypothetical protein